MGIIHGICISEKKGTPKHTVPEAELLEEWGIRGDAHAGKWHRQVSLLGLGQIEAFRARGAEVDFGAFGENLIVDGFRFRELPVGTRLRAGNVLLEITQIGKECHSRCKIYEHRRISAEAAIGGAGIVNEAYIQYARQKAPALPQSVGGRDRGL